MLDKPERDPTWAPLIAPEHRQDRLRRRATQGRTVTDLDLLMDDAEFDKLCDAQAAARQRSTFPGSRVGPSGTGEHRV